MHDIGKVNLTEKVLNKSTPLNEKEWSDIRDHSVVGAHILREVAILAEIAPLVLHHHERYDGTGYPNKLKGKEIPFLSRVLTVVDSFDAMTFDRPYKAGMSWAQAIVELRANKGTQFDPDIVEAFISVIEESLRNDPERKSLRISIPIRYAINAITQATRSDTTLPRRPEACCSIRRIVATAATQGYKAE